MITSNSMIFCNAINTITAKDKDPDKKQNIHIEDKERKFNVRCYIGTEWGICQKKGECNKGSVEDSPDLGCSEGYECCKVGPYDNS